MPNKRATNKKMNATTTILYQVFSVFFLQNKLATNKN
jgi:hypothetical protein